MVTVGVKRLKVVVIVNDKFHDYSSKHTQTLVR